MRLARLRKDDLDILAFVDGDRFLPTGSALPGAPQDLGAFLRTASWNTGAEAAARHEGWLSLEGVTWLPPLGPASRIFCVGKNYADHAREMGMTAPGGPAAPDIFIRFPSSFVGHGGDIEYPVGDPTFDFEGELAVVMGRAGRAIAPADAWNHVFGLTAANDGSLRRLQKRTSQFTLGKNFDRSGALGPTIAPIHAFDLPLRLGVRTFVDDAVMQNGNTDQMLFDVPHVIATISAITELEPGDIILTGTPAGVGAGRTPPLFLSPGQRLRVEIDALDSLEVSVQPVDIEPV
ncbi:fumarylacetoacetate hydrolase family protein [Kordiimonas aestuarii]|uniref:fumarylacetoacetate hydrolase family protein n=1 Tax=Kordiimonas aestuarii TaxID=1005925 RepID=UPI0021D0063D|nr:fumarylacetoacetate hydrolase family protein [Kordiimonas aestuarii]